MTLENLTSELLDSCPAIDNTKEGTATMLAALRSQVIIANLKDALKFAEKMSPLDFALCLISTGISFGWQARDQLALLQDTERLCGTSEADILNSIQENNGGIA